MELPNSLVLIFTAVLGLLLFGWFLVSRVRSVLQEKRDDPSLLLLQQQIEQLRAQFGHALDSNAQSIQQQLGQMLGHVNDRLRENAEVLNRTQHSLGERLDNAARVVGNVQRMAEWNRNTEKVEMLPSVGGKETTKQSFKGGMVMTIITTESAPPHYLVRTLSDANGPFVGSWTYEISPADAGSKIVLTEVAEFKSPLFRVMTRIFGQTKYMDEHLEDLAKKFGETPTVM